MCFQMYRCRCGGCVGKVNASDSAKAECHIVFMKLEQYSGLPEVINRIC